MPLKLALKLFLCILLILGPVSSQTCKGDQVTNTTEIRRLLRSWNSTMMRVVGDFQKKSFDWSVDIKQSTLLQLKLANGRYLSAVHEIWEKAICIDCVNCSKSLRRRLRKYTNIGVDALPFDLLRHYPVGEMLLIFSNTTVCYENSTKCLPLEPDLKNIMKNSRDPCELLWAWRGWRDGTGKMMKPFIPKYVELINKAAQLNGFETAEEMWNYDYTADDPTFHQQIDNAWNDVADFYKHLHAYVRRRLIQHYGHEIFPSSGHIPAHLLGDMWAQDWSGIYDLVKPFGNATDLDISSQLKKWRLKMEAMTTDFWKKSVFVRNNSRTMVCHASAWDMMENADFRLRMCGQVNKEYFETSHHEMGHIQYFMNYRNQPFEFREGANSGFHEAIGELCSLLAMSPGFLSKIGLVGRAYQESQESLMNRLMALALKRIAFLPFSYLMDKYRWSMFNNLTSFEKLNEEWWKLRSEVQGIIPPVLRSVTDFDAGAKYHVAASEKYFYATIAQFQFFYGLCEKAGYRNKYICELSNSTQATAALKKALSVGSSKPHPKVFSLLSNGKWKGLNSSAILDYFKPLYHWLQSQNRGLDVEWKDYSDIDISKFPVCPPSI